jgi:hypothetical protein
MLIVITYHYIADSKCLSRDLDQEDNACAGSAASVIRH